MYKAISYISLSLITAFLVRSAVGCSLGAVTAYRLQSVANKIVSTAYVSAWQDVAELVDKSEKASEYLRSGGPADSTHFGVAVIMALVCHLVDDYSKEYLDPRLHEYLVKVLFEYFIVETTDFADLIADDRGVDRLNSDEKRQSEEITAEFVSQYLSKFEQYRGAHVEGPDYRGENGQTVVTSSAWGLASVFMTDSEVRKEMPESWEEMDQDTLSLYDTALAITYRTHLETTKLLREILETKGFAMIPER